MEDTLVRKYASLGRISPGGELYLPIGLREMFVNECIKLKVAIIAVELFHRQGEKIIPVNPIRGIDCSSLLKEYIRWDDIIESCNKNVLEALNSETDNDNTLYFNPTLFEESDWKK